MVVARGSWTTRFLRRSRRRRTHPRWGAWPHVAHLMKENCQTSPPWRVNLARHHIKNPLSKFIHFPFLYFNVPFRKRRHDPQRGVAWLRGRWEASSSQMGAFFRRENSNLDAGIAPRPGSNIRWRAASAMDMAEGGVPLWLHYTALKNRAPP